VASTKKAHETTKRVPSKKLLSTVILVTVVLSTLLIVYYVLLQPHGDEWTAALVDQLAVEESLYRPEFNNACTQLLAASGYSARYYPGKDVTIDFYEELPSKGRKIVLVRAHSAVREGSAYVDLFTSEIYDERKASDEYAYLALNRHISKASFNVPPYTNYFAVGPSFVSSVMKGGFSDCFIVLMGCNSLNQTSMAEALVVKGARVIVGWTGNVTVSDTDTSVLHLLDLLLKEDYTVHRAVEMVNEHDVLGDTKLDYYPKDDKTRSYRVPTRSDAASLPLLNQPMLLFSLPPQLRTPQLNRTARAIDRADTTSRFDLCPQVLWIAVS